MNASMEAAVIDRFGGPDVLRAVSVARPQRHPGELLVAVRACGVCGHDLLARRGELTQRLPRVLGHEIAGEVVEADGAFGPGDRVVLVQRVPCMVCMTCQAGAPNLCTSGAGFYGENLPGGYAQLVVARPENTVRLPDAVSFEQAAALPCGISTGLHAVGRLALQPGETVLVTGASGGVGINALQLVRMAGGVPIGVVREPAVADAVLEAGAEQVVVVGRGAPARTRLRDTVRSVHPGGVDAAIECVGTPLLAATLSCLRPAGRVAIAGNVDPREGGPPLGLTIVRELTVLGSSHGTRDDLELSVELVASGAIQPRIARVLPLAQAAAAHALLERGAPLGRVIMQVEQIT